MTAVTVSTADPAPATHRSRDQSALLPILALAAVAVIWGVTFTVVDDSTDALPPADLVAWRFGIGAVVLYLVRRRRSALPPTLRRRGVVLGGLLGLGFLLQAWALTFTDALMSGFLTSLLVVVAPITAWALFRERLSGAVLVGVATATGGLALLGLQQAGFGPGEMLTLCSAVAWGLHLVLLARWSRPAYAVDLAAVQTGTVAGMALLVVAVDGLRTDSSLLPELPTRTGTWVAVLFLALIATAGAMILLSWSQGKMSATKAAVILTLEPAVAGLTAAALGAELTTRTLLGGVLLLAAMVIVELGSQLPPESADVEPA